MAHALMNPVFLAFSGQIGDLIFRRQNGRMTIVKKAEVVPREPTERQKAMRMRFRQGTLYGKATMCDPSAKTVYAQAAREKHTTIYSLMVGDFLNPPVVEEVNLSRYTGQPGEEITVRATDDFGVVGVTVRIIGGDGVEIEKGTAVESGEASGIWMYRATTQVPPGSTVQVEATAIDRPGHTGVKVESKG